MKHKQTISDRARVPSSDIKIALLLLFLFALFVLLEPNRARGEIFDWQTFTDMNVEGVTPVPHVGNGGESNDWQYLFDDMAQQGRQCAVMMRVSTSPHISGSIFGIKNPQVLGEVIDYVEANGQELDYVFMDYECSASQVDGGICTKQDVIDSVAMTVDMVRSSASPAVHGARIGQYNFFPGDFDASELWGNYDRSEAAAHYLDSGLDIAMPSLYPNTAYRNHHTRPDKHSQLAVSLSHALFWTPLHRFSMAKQALPEGHRIIPWIGGLRRIAGYEAPDPTREEMQSLLLHVRLRGADGYYTWAHGDSIYYSSRLEFRDDMYRNGWQPLDWFFALEGETSILNLGTDKTGGLEWSGMRRGNRVVMAYSNYGASEAQVDLSLAGVSGLPRYSPPIPPGGHLLRDYVLGPQAQWQLNEGSGSTTSQSDNGDGGGMSGTSMIEGDLLGTEWVPGIVGEALQFNGGASVDFGDVYDLGRKDRTITLWFKTAVYGNSQAILSKGSNIGNNQHAIFVRKGKVKARLNLGGSRYSVSSSSRVDDDQWHHLAVVIERGGRLRLYLDGQEESSKDIGSKAGTDVQNASSLMLGRTDRGHFYQGQVDGLRFYSSALSARAILEDHRSRLLLRLDTVAGSDVRDESIGQRNATTPCQTWGEGRYGGSLNFDHGCGVSFGDILNLGLGDRTLSLWFRTDATGTHQTLLSKGYSATKNSHAIFMYNGKLVALMDVSGTDRIVNSGNTLVNDGQWHHMVLVMDRDGAMTMYIDGQQTGSTSIAGDAAIDEQNNYPLYIGRSSQGQHFIGDMDEVMVLDGAVTGAELAQLMAQGW